MSKLDSPAARRNRQPILEVLRPRLAAVSSVLEIASGSGQHAAYFAERLPQLTWQPTERDGSLFRSIRAWTGGLSNVEAPVELDVTGEDWSVTRYDAVFNANMIHISPWETCVGLFAGAARHLAPAGRVFLYGPFRVGGEHTAPSNAAFDADLRGRDASWGVRDLEAVREVAAKSDFEFAEALPMPANNQFIVFDRS